MSGKSPSSGMSSSRPLLRSLTMSQKTRPSPAPLPLLSVADLKTAARPARWLWQGFLTAGAITLLTSQWKAGKTTLLAVLLSKMKTGGRLAGLKVAAGRAVVLTEEGP